MTNDSYFRFDYDMIKYTHIFLIITRGMGKLKTHSPISCTKDNWENWLNLRYTLDRMNVCIMMIMSYCHEETNHDDVIKWKHFPRYWPFVRGIHRSPVNSPHKGQWRGTFWKQTPSFPKAGDIDEITGRIWWYNHLRHTSQKNMTTVGKVDTSDLMITMKWVTDTSFGLPKLE